MASVPFTSAALTLARPDEARSPRRALRLGFACAWDADARPTWSYTPWNLREALREHAEVVDLGVKLPVAARTALKVLHARRRDGHLVSSWKHSGLWDRVCRATLAPRARRASVNAVLEIQDLAPLDVPYFVYQDMSYDVLLRLWEPGTRGIPHFPMLDLETIRRRRDRQHRIYAEATGVLAMSAWFARTLVEWTGLPPEKVHVVHPGANVLPTRPLPRRDLRPRRRLLLIGKDFHTKAGDAVVTALGLLRRDLDPKLTLTIAGPRTWPLPSAIPDGVRFLGRVGPADVARLYDTHDLLVMPSRFEAFGIAFVEALARGLPCIGRRAFAMPELITPGRNGDLVADDSPAELAAVIARALVDDALYLRCQSDAARVATHFTWDRAAQDAVAAIRNSLARADRTRMETPA